MKTKSNLINFLQCYRTAQNKITRLHNTMLWIPLESKNILARRHVILTEISIIFSRTFVYMTEYCFKISSYAC
jgi:hypothetical protein